MKFNKYIIIPVLGFILMFSGCKLIEMFKIKQTKPGNNAVESYVDWINNRIKIIENENITRCKISGKLIRKGKNLQKDISFKFGVLLNLNGDESFGVYKGMALLIKYQKIGAQSVLETSEGEIAQDSDFLIDLIMKEFRFIFLPDDSAIQNPVRNEKKDKLNKFIFSPETYTLKQGPVILQKNIIFFDDSIREIEYYDNVSGEKFIFVYIDHFKGNFPFEYPQHLINISFFPEELEIQIILDQIEYN